MRNVFVMFGFMVLSCLSAEGTVYYEGTFAFHNHHQINWSLMQQLAPPDPIIVHVGAYTGLDTHNAARIWPEAKIFALEASPRAYVEMLKHIAETNFKNIKTQYLAIGDHKGTAPFYLSRGPNGDDISYEHASSLLPLSPDLGASNRETKIEVPCMSLDDWCQLNNIDHIDILKLELEGFELQALQCSPNILKKVKIIYLPSFFSADRVGMTYYFSLKDFLYKSNFVVLAHWYTQGGRGNAVYVRQELLNGIQ